jgi:cytochrome c peroxidase
MRRIVTWCCLLAMTLLVAFKKKNAALFEKPERWPEPVYDFKKKPLAAKKIELGRMLFYDPILSRDSTISCASCHSQYTAFTHTDHDLSHGIEGRIGTRNSPALMNLAWGSSFMWDGSIAHIDEQALAPISNPLEMDEKIEHVVHKLQMSKKYPSMFNRAYGDTVVDKERILGALSQFIQSTKPAGINFSKPGARTAMPSHYLRPGNLRTMACLQILH